MLNIPKSRKIAAVLALTGTILPLGLHKFYLGQPLWGVVYLLLCWTPFPRVASAIDALLYLAQDKDEFEGNFKISGQQSQPSAIGASEVTAIADALRQLDQLRQEGLISEYEFEQKRRQWLDRMV